MRVLVVDDDDLVRTVAVDTLEDAGFEVIEAATAEEALDRCDERTADVLFTDIMLSGSSTTGTVARSFSKAVSVLGGSSGGAAGTTGVSTPIALPMPKALT